MNSVPRTCSMSAAALLGLLATSAEAQQPKFRVDEMLSGPAPPPGVPFAPPPCSSLAALAWTGQPVPSGGSLKLPLHMPSTVGPGGSIAFMAQVEGAERNQGIFVADANGLHPIAMGCGGPGGSGLPGPCGDPSPIGGSFSGFFVHPAFMPAINSGGDVLFIADVVGGSAKRGLFLSVAATGAIVKVAAPGDDAPGGGAFTKVGVGSLGDGGDVAFLASTSPGLTADVYRWSAGVISKVVAVGDPAPGGGTVDIVADQSLIFADGTKIPFGLAPAINASGQVAARIHSDTQGYEIIVSTDGVAERYVGVGDTSPAGGTYVTFSAPYINAWGEVGFHASLTGGSSGGGLFAGMPGAWRKVMLTDHVLPSGGACVGLSNSQNPATPLDDAGNFVFWAMSEYVLQGKQVEGLFEVRADGGGEQIGKELQANPLGFPVVSFNDLVSQRDGVVSFAVTDSLTPTSMAAHLTLTDAVTWRDLGHPLAGTAGLPRLRGDGDLSLGSTGALHLTSARPLAAVWLMVGTSASPQPFKGGVLLPAPLVAVLAFATNATGTLDLVWPHWPPGLPWCSALVFQAWIQDPAALQGAAASNGLLGRVR
jgi:hypothetical protein